MKNNTDTKCNMVQQYIINLIKEHNLSEGNHLPTSEELCKKLSVSRVTVQNAYSVLQSAGVLYRKRGGGTFVGERPSEKSSEALSILPFIIYNNDPTNAAVLKMIRGAEDYLCDKGYYVTVHSPYCDTQKETKIIDSLINSGIKSMIVFPHDSNYNRDFYFSLIKKGIKIVFVDILPNDINGNLVCSDNISGGYYAAKHLLGKGYTHIGFISQALTEYTTISERFKGYQYAHNEAGIEPDSKLWYFYDSQKAGAPERLEAFLRKCFSLPNTPQAFCCINDSVAIICCELLKKMGLNVPKDVAVTGFDNILVSETNSPPITTITQYYYEMGYYAAKLCLDTSFKGFTKISLPVTLVERKSTEKNI